MVLRSINNTFLNPNQITDINELSATRTKKTHCIQSTLLGKATKLGRKAAR